MVGRPRLALNFSKKVYFIMTDKFNVVERRMRRQKQHEIMEARLQQWRMQKTSKTPQTRGQPTNKKKLPCGEDASGMISCRTQQKGQMSKSVTTSRRKQRSKQEEGSVQGQRPVLQSKQQDVQCNKTGSDLTMREKLEAWLVEKKKRMEFEKAQIKIQPWNSNKRKLPVSRLEWQSDTNIKLRDVATSKYRGYYGQAKDCRSASVQDLCSLNTPQREAINLKENVMTDKNSVKRVKRSVEVEGLEMIRVSSTDLIQSGVVENTVNENKTEKNRRARLEEWLTAKGKTPQTVKRSVRRETFDVVKLNPELEQCVEVDEGTDMKKREVDINCALDECLQTCLDFMNQMKNESKVGDWLEELHERCPQVTGRALFWVCRAKAAERAGYEQQHILALYEQAIDNKAKPTDILKSALQDFTTRYSQRVDITPSATPKSPLCTPGPVSSSILKFCTTAKVDEGTSSVVRYSLVKSTPIVNRLNESMDGSSQRFLVTPVRRSIRLEKSVGRDHSSRGNNRCIASLQDLPADMESLVMKPNRALQEEFMGTIDE